MEICIAVAADWARGPTTWAPGVPGGASTGATTDRPGSSGPWRVRTERAAGMVAGWG
ncbi:hypothetical protein GTW43_34535 [Streptomyces sp. SID5785]|nr:hypothetical protein [Streptomyces sp. SID5785]